MDQSIFVKAILSDRITVSASYLHRGIKQEISGILKRNFEGKCSHHGYIKLNSIDVVHMSSGKIQDFSLNGAINYNVKFSADVCNPSVGSILEATVVNSNRFGIMAECYTVVEGARHPVIEVVVVANQSSETSNELDIQKIRKGQTLRVEVLGKKFELNDKKLSVVGRILSKKANIKLDADVDRDGKDSDDEDVEDPIIEELEDAEEEPEKEDGDVSEEETEKEGELSDSDSSFNEDDDEDFDDEDDDVEDDAEGSSFEADD